MNSQEIRVGSKIYLGSVQTVVRETKTMFITEYAVRFYKKDFREVGSCRKVILATQEHFDTVEKNELIFRINKVDLHSISLEKIRDLHKLLLVDTNKKVSDYEVECAPLLKSER